MNGSGMMLLSLLLMASTAQVLASSPTAEEAFAVPALIGMQLSIRKTAAEGKAPDSLVACVNRLSSNSFVPVFRSLMEQNLSLDEMTATEHFFLSPTGRRYAKHGIAQLYAAVGEPSPEPAPTFSDSEYAELEQFSQTSAGKKLMTQKVMESASARRAVAARIQELLGFCRAE